MDEPPRLSKSRFTQGLRCHRALWWRVHEPDAPELVPDAEREATFALGHRIGALAREQFPGGVLIDVPHTESEERVRRTAEAMGAGAPAIFEAAFVADGTFVAVDVLERGDDGWRLIEVKSALHVKEAYCDDVAVQFHVVRASGTPVVRAEVMHLNRDCVAPDLSNLFVRDDVTADAERRLARVPELIRGQRTMLAGPLPDVPIGPQCRAPYACEFIDRCWRNVPAHHVSTLYNSRKLAWELAARGIATVDRVPDGLPLRVLAERQRAAVRDGRRYVGPGLGAALAALPRPLAVLDFETVGPAFPAWTGCRPYESIPAQFSVRVEDGRGGWDHHAWLAEGPGDPRPELVRRVADALLPARTVLAYSADFERGCLVRAARALPALAAPVAAVLARLVDALALVRDHVYDPAFFGGFGLKAVLPALVPGMSYDALPIADGRAASRTIERLLLEREPSDPVPRARLRDQLLDYCGFDTLAVVRLLEALEAIAAGRGG